MEESDKNNTISTENKELVEELLEKFIELALEEE